MLKRFKTIFFSVIIYFIIHWFFCIILNYSFNVLVLLLAGYNSQLYSYLSLWGDFSYRTFSYNCLIMSFLFTGCINNTGHFYHGFNKKQLLDSEGGIIIEMTDLLFLLEISCIPKVLENIVYRHFSV